MDFFALVCHLVHTHLFQLCCMTRTRGSDLVDPADFDLQSLVLVSQYAETGVVPRSEDALRLRVSDLATRGGSTSRRGGKANSRGRGAIVGRGGRKATSTRTSARGRGTSLRPPTTDLPSPNHLTLSESPAEVDVVAPYHLYPTDFEFEAPSSAHDNPWPSPYPVASSSAVTISGSPVEFVAASDSDFNSLAHLDFAPTHDNPGPSPYPVAFSSAVSPFRYPSCSKALDITTYDMTVAEETDTDNWRIPTDEPTWFSDMEVPFPLVAPACSPLPPLSQPNFQLPPLPQSNLFQSFSYRNQLDLSQRTTLDVIPPRALGDGTNPRQRRRSDVRMERSHNACEILIMRT